MHDWGLESDLLKSDRVGKDSESEGERCMEGERSSPRRHCPQKAVVAHAATAASRGRLRSSLVISWDSILALIGGRSGCLQFLGAEL